MTNKQLDNKPLEPIMPYPLCPFCGNRILLDKYTYNGYDAPVTCPACKGKFHITLSLERYDGNGYLYHDPRILSPPRPIGDPQLLAGLIPVLPNELYVVYEEATRCLAFGVPKGAALLCRYSIQHALILKGVPDKPPEEMVNIASSRTPPLLSELAVRQCRAATFMGGKAGHPQANGIENINSDDAKQALLVTRRVLLELFNPSGLHD